MLGRGRCGRRHECGATTGISLFADRQAGKFPKFGKKEIGKSSTGKSLILLETRKILRIELKWKA
jgi:hypothetical protein